MTAMPRLVVCFLALYAAATGRLSAQDGWLGIEAGVGVSLRGAIGSMQPIPGVPSPGPLNFSADALAPQGFVSAGVDVPLAPSLRAGMRLHGGTMHSSWKAVERIPIARADSVYQASIEHRLTANATVLQVEPFLRWLATSALHVDVGLPIMSLLSASHRQTQRFADPLGIPFADGSTQQITSSGSVPGLRTIIPAVRGRVSYVIPLGTGAWQLVPSVAVGVSPFSLHGGTTWRDLAVDAGMTLRYEPTVAPAASPATPRIRTDTLVVRDTVTVLQPGMANPTPELLDRTVAQAVRVSDTVYTVTITERYRRVLPKPPAILEASVRVVFVDEGGKERTDATIVTKRQRQVRSVPLVPVVVFDAESTRLPDRYVQLGSDAAARFTEGSVLDSGVVQSSPHWAYHVLNVVGARLRRKPRQTLTLKTSGRRDIADARANDIRRYLKSAFGVDGHRLRHDHGRGGDTLAVLLQDASCDVIGPIVRSDTSVIAQLPSVAIYPDVVSDANVIAWTVDVSQSGRTVYQLQGSGEIPKRLLWKMDESVTALQALGESFAVRITVANDEAGMVVTDPARVMVREASIMDASAGMQTFGSWLVPSSPMSVRVCAPTPVQAAQVRQTYDLPNATTVDWTRGLLPTELPYWKGRWIEYRAER